MLSRSDMNIIGVLVKRLGGKVEISARELAELSPNAYVTNYTDDRRMVVTVVLVDPDAPRPETVQFLPDERGKLIPHASSDPAPAPVDGAHRFLEGPK